MVTSEGAAGATHPGSHLGLPAMGVGSMASFGSRLGAFLLDITLSALVGWLVTAPEPPRYMSLAVWAVMTVLAVGLFGFTPGQAALGIRVTPTSGKSFVGLWAIPRTALVFLVVPALILDPDGRGVHDRLCRTVVLRMR